MADRIDGTRSIEDSCHGDGYPKAPGWNLVPAVERDMGINKTVKGQILACSSYSSNRRRTRTVSADGDT